MLHQAGARAGQTALLLSPPRSVTTCFEASGVGHVDADVVAVGMAHPQDLTGKNLTGKIALVEPDRFYHRSSQVKNVADAGAKGMIYLSVAPDNLRQVGSVRRSWK